MAEINPSENFSTDERDNQDIKKVFGRDGKVRKISEIIEKQREATLFEIPDMALGI